MGCRYEYKIFDSIVQMLVSPRPLVLLLHSRHCFLDIKSCIRCSLSLDLQLAEWLLNLLNTHKLLDLEDHTGKLRLDRVKDCLHTATETQRSEHTPCALWQANR